MGYLALSCMLAAALAVHGADEFPFETGAGTPVGTRIRWEVPFRADLSACDGFEFDFRCSSLSQAGRGFTVYVFSGERGCYLAKFPVDRSGDWTHVTVRKHSVYNSERFPQGWADVHLIRISTVLASTNRLSGAVRNVRPLPAAPSAAVLYFEKSPDRPSPPISFPANRKLMYALEKAGVPAFLLSDRDLARHGVPPNVRLLFAAGDGNPPDDATGRLAEWVRAGGRIVCWRRPKAAAFRSFASEFRTQTAVDLRLGGAADDEIDECAVEAVVRRFAECFADSMDRSRALRAARERDMAAEVAAMPSVPDEIRTVSCHTPWGTYGGCTNWSETARLVKSCGFNRIVANFCRGMRAAYASKVLLPWNPPKGEWRDALEEARSACAHHGLPLTARRCCWTTPSGITTMDEIASRRAAGRLAKRIDGSECGGFGCPTHPENIRIEIESLVELAKKGVDGIDLDYIRYGREDACFCDRCRALFEKGLGRTADGWPQCVRRDAATAKAWADFRCGNISRVVEAVGERVHAEVPGVKVNMSGFPVPAVARLTVGQDWPYWCRQGWVDVVWMMDYCIEPSGLDALIRDQRSLDVGRATLYPLLGPSLWPDVGDDALRTARQIEAVRAAGYGGFSLFTMDGRVGKVLPALAAGPTRLRR